MLALGKKPTYLSKALIYIHLQLQHAAVDAPNIIQLPVITSAPQFLLNKVYILAS